MPSQKIKKTIKTLRSLQENDLLHENLPILEKVTEKFNVALTPIMAELIDNSDPNDPIAKQFIPSKNELKVLPYEVTDPIGDLPHTKVKGVVHRYPDRCLLKPINHCSVYCRFCFRKEYIGSGNEAMNQEDLQRAYAYISSHPEIWEVILTGGDPLILKPHHLADILSSLRKIKQVEVIRIHTRVPLVDPDRINDAMLAALKGDKPVYIILHANHPREFSQKGFLACARLVDAGIPMLSQSVLLKGVNDSCEVLGELMRTFIKNRIKPYYLHHADLVEGTSHFRTTLEEGQQIMRELRGNYSGICQPTYVIDIPGGHGKSPVNACYVCKAHEGTQIQDYQGIWHDYPE